MLQKIKFSDCVEYMIKGPFGSDMKKSLYVPKGDDTYKVYIQGNAIQQDETLGEYYVSEEYFHSKLERFEVHPGDYIITCDGTLGKFLKLGENIERGVISSSLLLLKLDEEKIYDKYFELLWEYSMLGYLASQARNACLIHLPSAKAIGDVEIELPPIVVQKEIADKAYSIKRICNNRIDEIKLLDDLIKARFVEMFGHQSHNEKGLPYMTIDDVAEIYLGITHTPEYVEEGVTFISAKNTSGDFLDLTDVKYISREEFSSAPNGSKPQKNDVLFSRVGSNLGHPVILEDDIELCTFVSLGFLRTKGKVTSNYLKHWMRDDYFPLQVAEHVKGGGQPNLNTGWLKQFKIIVPDLDAQYKFDAFCKQVDKSKVAVQKSLDETQKLFDSLMQEYFG